MYAPLRWYCLAGIVVLLAGAAALAYSNSFRVPFIFDDPAYISDRPGMGAVLRPWEVSPSRPVLGFTLAVNYRLGGLSPWGYHAVNLLIHVLAGLVLFGLARRTLQGEVLAPRLGKHAAGLALAMALLWTLHPLQTQAVTYVIQRGESLMGLFYLLTVYCAARAHGSRRAGWWWTGALAACALGLGAKQVLVTAPLAVALYYWVFFPGAFRSAAARRGLVAGLFAAWLGGAAGLAWVSTHVSAGFGLAGTTPWTYAWKEAAAILHYLRLSLWPEGLCLDYGWPARDGLGVMWPWVAPVAALVALTAWGVWRRKPLAFPAAWFFLILAPTSSFMPISDVVEEHRMYLPLAGVVALVVAAVYLGGSAILTASGSARLTAGGARLVEHFPSREALKCAVGQFVGWGLVGAAAVALGTATFRRNQDYQSEEAIWRDAAAKSPQNPIAYCNLGVELGKQERFEEARWCYEQAVALSPGFPEALNGLGVTLTALGEPYQAVPRFQQALERRPEYAKAHCGLGSALLDLGQPAQALPELLEALRLNPEYTEAHVDAGKALGQLGRLPEALPHLQEAVRLDPNYAEAHCNLGAALAMSGRLPEAIEHYEAALRLKPGLAEAHYNLANALLLRGRPAEAVPHYREAVRLNPGYFRAQYNLARVLVQQGQYAEALPSFAQALKLAPRSAEAHSGLGVCLVKTGNTPAALPHFKEAMKLGTKLPEPFYYMGVAAFEQGFLEPAAGYLERAVELDPNLTAAREKLAGVQKALAAKKPVPPKE